MTETQHEYKSDVDKFMDRIKKAINLRLESDRIIHRNALTRRETAAKLRQESDKILREAEYTLYELIDKALEVAP
jgi:hypothetical protein